MYKGPLNKLPIRVELAYITYFSNTHQILNSPIFDRLGLDRGAIKLQSIVKWSKYGQLAFLELLHRQMDFNFNELK